VGAWEDAAAKESGVGQGHRHACCPLTGMPYSAALLEVLNTDKDYERYHLGTASGKQVRHSDSSAILRVFEIKKGNYS
jgi:hypothetical protein